MPRRLRVNLEDVIAALDNSSADAQYYLDLETGDVVLVSQDTRRNLDNIYDELMQYEEDGPWAIQRGLEDSGLSEAEQAGVLALFLMEGGYGSRYSLMPRFSTDAVLREMGEFIATVQDTETARALNVALNDRNPYRRFHDVLAEFPAERDRWTQFRAGLARQRALAWLQAEGIEPVLA